MKIKRIAVSLIATAFLLCTNTILEAQDTGTSKSTDDYSLVLSNNNSEINIRIHQKLAAMKPQDYLKMYKNVKIRSQKHREALRSYFGNQSKSDVEKPFSATELPAKFRVPAEYEEIQSVYIAWPYNAFDSADNFVEPFIKGYALDYEEVTPGQYRPKLITIQVFEPDVENNSPYAHTWMKLANIIQREVPVWIQIHRPQDSNIIKSFCESNKMPLTNYRFMLKDSWGNAFWMRDCGPYGFYYGDNDSLAFLDAAYYPGRPLDDDIPEFIANAKGYKNFVTGLETEGGNFMTDGYGTGFYSDALFENNNDNLGRGYTAKTPVSPANLRDTIIRVFGLGVPVELKSLQCDGGTGHIDIYTKILNDKTIAVTEYPEIMRNSAFTDYANVEVNLKNKISKAVASDGKTFDIVRMPLPTSDNGQYDSITCESFGWDARGFINGLFVNNTFIFPSYSDEASGNSVLDAEAKSIFEKTLPGYRVEPLDSRWLTPLGGAMHCITMQIPAENPVKVKHKPLTGILAKPMQGGFDISAIIYNHSGIAASSLKWRKKTEVTFNEIVASASDATNLDIIIPSDNLKNGDEIEYYFSVVTKNGRSLNYPFSAPAQHFGFKVGEPNSAEEKPELIGALEIIPNPFIGEAICRFSIAMPAQIELKLADALGREVKLQRHGLAGAGSNSFVVNSDGLPQGLYLAALYANGLMISSTRVIIR